MEEQEINEEIKIVYKELSKIAEENGFYLMPTSFYNKMMNVIEKLKREIIRARNSRDNWRIKYERMKNS